MKYFIPPTILTIAFTQLLASSYDHFKKTSLELVLEGKHKLATECHMETFIYESARARTECGRKCHSLKGYINEKEELICYSTHVPTVRVSVKGENCSCGFPRFHGRQDCIPKLQSNNIPDVEMCDKECFKYTAFRLKKFQSKKLYTIWCEEGFVEARERKLDYGLDIKSGIGSTTNLQFKCTCGLKDEYKRAFRMQNPAFNDVQSESNQLDSASCSDGPFWVQDEIDSCQSFCETAKGYFLPSSNELICYHDAVRASVMPQPSTNQNMIPGDGSEIICRCGGYLKNLTDGYYTYSPCTPARKYVKPRETPFGQFQSQCEIYCANFVAFFVYTYPAYKVVRCYSQLPETTVSKLNFKIIRPKIQYRPGRNSTLCECGVPISKNHTEIESYSRQLDYVDDIADDFHADHPSASYENHFTSIQNHEQQTPNHQLNSWPAPGDISNELQTNPSPPINHQQVYPLLQSWSLSQQQKRCWLDETMQSVSPADYKAPSPTCHRGRSTLIIGDVPTASLNELRTIIDEFPNGFNELEISPSRPLNRRIDHGEYSLVEDVFRESSPILPPRGISSDWDDRRSNAILPVFPQDHQQLPPQTYNHGLAFPTPSPNLNNGFNECSLKDIFNDLSPISLTRSISSDRNDRRFNGITLVSPGGNPTPSQACEHRGTFPSPSPYRNDGFADYSLEDVFNKLAPIISPSQNVGFNELTPIISPSQKVGFNELTPIISPNEKDVFNELTPIILPSQEDVFNELTPIISPSQKVGFNELTPIISPSQEDVFNELRPIILPSQEDVSNELTPIVLPSQEDVFNELTPIISPSQKVGFNELAPIISPSQEDVFNELSPIILPSQEDVSNELTPIILPSQEDVSNELTPIISPSQEDVFNELTPIISPSHASLSLLNQKKRRLNDVIQVSPADYYQPSTIMCDNGTGFSGIKLVDLIPEFDDNYYSIPGHSTGFSRIIYNDNAMQNASSSQFPSFMQQSLQASSSSLRPFLSSSNSLPPNKRRTL